jgi:hypothetical protein
MEFPDLGTGGSPAASWRLQLFPNLALAPTNLRVVRPIAVDHTEVRQYNVGLPGVPAAAVAARIRSEQTFYGPGGYGASDDMEIFERIQEGCRAATNEDLNPYVWLNRGLTGERRGDHGERIAHTTSEVEQRAIYYAWRAWMSE